MAKAKRKRKATTTLLPWSGDHGPSTAAATAMTEVVPIEGSNPNRMAQRRRINHVQKLKERLSQRQYQAALAIQEAYCRVEMLSSGSALKEQVDASPRPDANMAVQVAARSHLVYVMKPVPSAMRDVIEHVCWHNRPISQMDAGGKQRYNRMADFKVALDLVANHMRY